MAKALRERVGQQYTGTQRTRKAVHGECTVELAKWTLPIRSLCREPYEVKISRTGLTGGMGRRTVRQRALCLPSPHGWVTGDDEFGRHTRFRQALRERGERYVLGVPCTTMMRDLEAPWPAYQGRGRRPKAPWQSVTTWRKALRPEGWTRLTVRNGEKGPVALEMVTRRVQTRFERKRTGPE